MDDAFGFWLAGLIDGEGSFGITKQSGYKGRNTYFTPRLQLRLRDDDREVVELIHKVTGLGSVHTSQTPTNPQVGWYVARKDDTFALVQLLDKYPLRTKKRRDYEIWREAVLIHHSTQAPDLGLFKSNLEAVRKYERAAA